MKAKKYLMAAIVLSTVFLAIAASRQAKRGAIEPKAMPLSGNCGEFGPVIDTVLPAAKNENAADILDLEIGKALPQPPLDLDSRADEVMAWVRSNGLDISCSVWSNGAACVTYDMTVVGVERKCWDESTSGELLENPELSPKRHSPRRLLVLGNGETNTYMFRTGDGTLGMLRIIGLSRDGRGVQICYKLINPAQSLSVAL